MRTAPRAALAAYRGHDARPEGDFLPPSIPFAVHLWSGDWGPITCRRRGRAGAGRGGGEGAPTRGTATGGRRPKDRAQQRAPTLEPAVPVREEAAGPGPCASAIRLLPRLTGTGTSRMECRGVRSGVKSRASLEPRAASYPWSPDACLGRALSIVYTWLGDWRMPSPLHPTFDS